ncbi:MAG TPA: sigma 54-interacting transcriptional regulator [Pyrinomonadaceae bacterium]|jgi:DNA-binding NtrC family response regulator
MNLATSLLQRLDEPRLSPTEKARLRCALAKALADAGNYEAASHGLGAYWAGVGVRPVLSGLDEDTQAELLLRVGALSGWLGSARQLAGAQEAAKDLLSESIARFEALGAASKAAEAQIEIAWCYLREGAHDEARLLLRLALERLGPADCELRAIALVRWASIERAADRVHDALARLFEAEPLALASDNDALKGKFHSALATILAALGDAEGRPDYIDRALIEYAAASFHFEQSGHARYCARVENNLGFLFYRLARFAEAHEHLRRARSLFVSVKEPGSTAQVDETIARALLAEGRTAEAERRAAQAVRALSAGDEQAPLAEALTTHGIALARLRRLPEARAAFERAQVTAERAGDEEGAGRAVLSLLEELGAALTPPERRALYRQADRLLARAQHAETLARLRACARGLLDEDEAPPADVAAPVFVHAAAQTAELLREARLVAQADGAVLLSGETGTGKEVLARLLHGWSGRRGPFVAVNCAALCATLFESQLFGHRKGSFTDATDDYAGAARAAAGGTLFLDEIGELDLANQAKLLRLIEQGEVYAVGSAMPERVNVRIVAATNHDLVRQIERGRFRPDLFYRLAGFHLLLSPLRERPDDIPALARHFIEEAARLHAKRIVFPPETVEAMRALPLAGNVRELRALVERTYITAPDGAVIAPTAVETVALRGTQKAGFAEQWAGCSLEEEMRAYEGRLIRLALDTAQGSVTGAARLLQITHQGLAYILGGRQKALLAKRRPPRQRRARLMPR